MLHRMKLNNEPYELMKKGIKTIELRLNDDKRKRIKAGDTILFINTTTQRWLAAKVKALHLSPSFKDLFEQIGDKKSMGFLNEEETTDQMALQMRQYYSQGAELENGVVGIELERPETEMDFPVECDESDLKYVIVAAFYDGKLVFCKHKDRQTIELPGGHIEPGEDALTAAKRELYEETGITDLRCIQPICAYKAKATTYESNGAYGMLFAVQVEKMPETIPDFEMEKTELFDITPHRKLFEWEYPQIPMELTHHGVYSVVLHYLQRMLANDDICFSEEETDYYHRLKYYEEDVCVDYESFDADFYLHYVMMRPDCDDYFTPLERVAPTEENYQNIRYELLYCCDVFEYFTVLVDKFGAERVKNDEELMDKVYRAFDAEYVDDYLDE